MNSSRTRFGRISIKAKLPPTQGENRVWTGGSDGAGWVEERRGGCKDCKGRARRVPRVHFANGSRRPREQNGIPNRAWLLLAKLHLLYGGRVRSPRLLRDFSSAWTCRTRAFRWHEPSQCGALSVFASWLDQLRSFVKLWGNEGAACVGIEGWRTWVRKFLGAVGRLGTCRVTVWGHILV